MTSEAVDSPRPIHGTEDRDTSLFRGKRLFWIPILPLLILDLWTKAWAFDFVTQGKGLGRGNGIFRQTNYSEVFETGWLDFNLVTWLNTGTVWGLFAQWNFELRLLRVGAVALILYFVFRTPPQQRVMLVALSLILAGALGNMYDNFFHYDPAWSDKPGNSGAVRDFLHFFNADEGAAWNFPAFNVADSCITVGAITLFILMWRTPPAEKAAGKAAG